MRLTFAALITLVLSSAPAFAQQFEIGGHFSSAKWSEFDGNHTGFGGRLTWKPSTLIDIDAELTWYPNDFSDEGPAFSRSRFEGLFGATVGPRLGSVRPFVKAAGGFLNVEKTNGAFACIAIFPPPLACTLAGGDTLPVFEIGGGADVAITDRAFIRGDVGGRFLQYPGPTLDDNFEVREEGYFGGALRFTIGAGLRF